MEAQVGSMLNIGIIIASSSPWSAPAILVPKKTTDGKPKYRFCVDFRALMRRPNSVHIHCQYLKRLHLLSSGRNTFHFLTVIVDFGRFPLKRNTKSSLGLRFNKGTMSLISYHLVCQTVPQISNDSWT